MWTNVLVVDNYRNSLSPTSISMRMPWYDGGEGYLCALMKWHKVVPLLGLLLICAFLRYGYTSGRSSLHVCRASTP